MADFENFDIVRLGAVCKFDNACDIVNTWHVIIAAGGGLAFAQASVDFQEYLDALYDYIDGVQSNKVVDVHISVANVTQDTVWGAIAWDTYTGGSSTDPATSPQVACLGFARTSKSRVQFRKYLGVFPETHITDGEWASTVTTPVSDMMGYHIVGHTMGEGLVLQGCVYNYEAGTYTTSLSPDVSATSVIQRRRRRGRGS